VLDVAKYSLFKADHAREIRVACAAHGVGKKIGDVAQAEQGEPKPEVWHWL